MREPPGIPGWWPVMPTCIRKDFRKSLWFKSRHMSIEVPGELIERMYDYVIASQSLKENSRTWKW